jgi:hypothetical protein
MLNKFGKDETEFVAVNLFEPLDAVKAFAGPDYDLPVFEPEARCRLNVPVNLLWYNLAATLHKLGNRPQVRLEFTFQPGFFLETGFFVTEY